MKGRINRLGNFFFGEQSLKQVLVKNTFWSTVSNVGSQIIKFGIIIYAARVLGAEEYGFFAYALSIATIFTVLSDLGLNQVFFITVARRDAQPPAYFPTLILLRLGLVAAVMLFSLAVGPFIAKFPEAKILLPFAVLLIAFDDLRAFLNGLARAENRIDKEAFGNIAANLLIAILCLMVLRFTPTSYGLALAYLGGSFLGVVAVSLVVRHGIASLLKHLQFNIEEAKKILKLSIPFALASSMWMIMTTTDTLVIGWLRTASELGYYAAAQRPIMALSIVPTIFAASSLALIARAAKEGATERLKHLVEKLITLSIGIVLPLAIGGIITASPIINFLYGAEYMPAVLTFQLLFLTLVISYPATVVTNLILAHRQHRMFTVAMVAGAVGNLILDLLLIPFFGIAGSAIATIVALVIINGYMLYSAKKFHQFSILTFLPKFVIAATCMGIFTFALQLASVPVLINITLSAAVYIGALFAFKEPLLKELNNLTHPKN